MKRGLLATFAFGLIGAFAFAFYQYQGNPETDISDWYQTLLSWIQRGFSIVKDKAQSATGTENYFDKAVAIVADFESFSSHPYWDVDGYSIGFGHHFQSGDGFSKDSVLTSDEAQALLESDLQSFDACIDRSIKVALSVSQRAALLSLVYNIGCSRFSGSTLVRLLNQGDYVGAEKQFAVWRIAGGEVNATLVARRSKEAEIFNS